MNQYQLQWRPKPGQLLLYIDFSEIKQRSIGETLTLLEQLGYQPQLRYLESQDSEGKTIVKLYALLKDEQHEPTVQIPEDYLESELEALYEAIQPDDLAIRCPRGLLLKKPAAV